MSKREAVGGVRFRHVACMWEEAMEAKHGWPKNHRKRGSDGDRELLPPDFAALLIHRRVSFRDIITYTHASDTQKVQVVWSCE